MKANLQILNPTIAEVCSVVEGEFCGSEKLSRDAVISTVSTSSSECTEGSLFVAIQGEKTHGVRYTYDAVRRGAVCVMTDKIPDEVRDMTEKVVFITVPDVIEALGNLAAHVRGRSQAKFIAVTGSVGKTTTKEFIYHVSSMKYRTFKTEGNHNNEIGLPMSLLSMPADTQVAVMEMGMSGFGEISYLSKIVRPDISVITIIGSSHLESLGTRENICRAKLEIVDGMTPSGIILLPSDEPLIKDRLGSIKCNRKFVGINSVSADYKALNIRNEVIEQYFDVIYEKNHIATNVKINVAGKHNVLNALNAFAVGVFLGIPSDLIVEGLRRFTPVEMRQNISEHNGVTVIDDCYNASPESMKAGMEVLVTIARKKELRPIAVLGDMYELGEGSSLMHEQVGYYAAKSGVDMLFCLGEKSENIAECAIKNGIRARNVYVQTEHEQYEPFAEAILENIQKNDILLFKASRGVHMERVLKIVTEKLDSMSEGQAETDTAGEEK